MNATSEIAVYSEVKQRAHHLAPLCFCGPITGNATGKNPKGIVNKTAGISLFLIQHINGNRV